MQTLRTAILYTLQITVLLSFCSNSFFCIFFWLFQNGMNLLGSKCVERHINQERGKKKRAIYSFTVPLGNHCLSFINMHFSTI